MVHSLLLAWLMLLPRETYAQDAVTVPVAGKLNLNSIVANMRGDFVIDQHLNKLAGAHLPLMTLHSNSITGLELINLNGGLIWDTNNGVGGPFVSLGGRMDNLFKRFGRMAWMKKHITVAILPAIEIGPFAGYVQNLGWLYGGFLAARYGGK